MTNSPELTLALALAAGIVAQSIAHHLRVPGIVVLLATGALLGPDALNLVQPATLGTAMHVIVGYAVAVVLFEGGLNLGIKRLRQESAVIRRLITIGALVTGIGGTLIAKGVLQWDGRLSVLFGALVIVTGPTVVTPLLRRIRLQRKLETILEAEGVLIDPIGAILAIVALEVVLQPSGLSLARGALDILLKLGVGSLLGAVGGLAIAYALRIRRLIPEGMENVFVLVMVFAGFHISNMIQSESGIAAVTVAGIVVGNIRSRVSRDLMEFKEYLTVMLIGMLFVLLAADVRLSHIRELGAPGFLAVGLLVLIVRPLNVAASTIGVDLTARDRIFLSWLAPRGIVAAAVASLFAETLTMAGIPGGEQLRALTFLVIAATVLFQGLTAGPLARALKLRRRSNSGWAILGAHSLGRAIARALADSGQEVVLVDSNQDHTRAAQEAGFRVIFGNALEERTLQRAGLDGMAGCLALTPNDEINYLFASHARKDFKVPRQIIAVQPGGHVTEKMLDENEFTTAFGTSVNVEMWNVRLQRGIAEVQTWQRTRREEAQLTDELLSREAGKHILVLTIGDDSHLAPITNDTVVKRGTIARVVVFLEKKKEVQSLLATEGWSQVAEDTDEQGKSSK